jgi:Tol biopolymer transport system component
MRTRNAAAVALVAVGLVGLGLGAAAPVAAGPANGLIVYQCIAGGGLQTDICVIDPADAGSEPVNLTDDFPDDAFPDWSPDMTQIVFDSFRTTNQPTIHVMNADGSNITQISSTPYPDRDFQAKWSPDGQKIAFVSTRDGDGEYEIYVMDAEGEIVGSPAVRLTNDPQAEFGQGISDAQIGWSPDSTRLVFVSNRDPDHVDACDIWVMDAVDLDGDGIGDNLDRLTNDNIANCDQLDELWGPTWSPDGSRIAFGSVRSGDYEIWVMDADGKNIVNVTQSPSTWEYQPDWSPDGSEILFVSARDGDEELYSTPAPPAAGSAAQRVAVQGIAPPVTQLTDNSSDDAAPAWGVVGGPVAPMCRGHEATHVMQPGDGTLEATDGPDVIVGTEGPDTINAGGGADVVCAGKKGDTVSGGRGPDQLLGQRGPDTLKGNGGNDELAGGRGTDTCAGGAGTDTAVSCETRTGIP